MNIGSFLIALVLLVLAMRSAYILGETSEKTDYFETLSEIVNEYNKKIQYLVGEVNDLIDRHNSLVRDYDNLLDSYRRAYAVLEANDLVEGGEDGPQSSDEAVEGGTDEP